MVDRNWDGVEQIGIDEISVFKGHRYLTCVYQTDKGMRRAAKSVVISSVCVQNEAVDQVRRDEVKELKDAGSLKNPSISCAGKFLEDWADMAMESELKPMQKVAKMLRSQKERILNWFSLTEGLSSGQNSLSKRHTALKLADSALSPAW